MALYVCSATCGCVVEIITYSRFYTDITRYCWKHWVLSFCNNRFKYDLELRN